MKILIVGLGLQGRAALHYLASSKEDTMEITVADSNLEQAKSYIRKFGNKTVKLVKLDAKDRKALVKLLSSGFDVVIDLLPLYFTETMAKAAVEAGVHLVNTLYTNEAIQKLDHAAARKGISILPEFGFDPGIDLVMAAKALGEFEEVNEFYSYGGGFPEPKACNNPLNYKITWTFDGVLRSYKRPARLLKNAHVVAVPGTEMFAPENIHSIMVANLGKMEAAPNGNAVRYRDVFKLGKGLKDIGRFVVRWPGHFQFWKKLVDLHFLDDEPFTINSSKIAPRDFLCKLLEPQLQYEKNEKDIAFIRIDVRGLKKGKKARVIYDFMDYRDLGTGLMAMNRTVGYTAAIGAKMIVRGDIKKRGVLSPARDVSYALLREELKKCGMRITNKECHDTNAD